MAVWLLLFIRRRLFGLYSARMTKWHLYLQLAAMLLMSIAGTAVFLAKRAQGLGHFTSVHSWGALTTLLFLLLNVFQVRCSNSHWTTRPADTD